MNWQQASLMRGCWRLLRTTKPRQCGRWISLSTFLDTQLLCGIVPIELSHLVWGRDIESFSRDWCSESVKSMLIYTYVLTSSILRGMHSQIVLLTDGMDTRPYRLPWPPASMIFDVSPNTTFNIAVERLEGRGPCYPWGKPYKFWQCRVNKQIEWHDLDASPLCF